ncbi:unnamed protein product [Hymenolepis diminuta]|uniref:GLTSCR1 domain-containing protein n=1 Tax=Hymenolepis diminuta TaxID=6216 RepID=A0A0R3S894_HYMDI|nr:unnamed protein product [Hymenolepis diminuta]
MTLLELLYVLNDNTDSKNNDVVKFKKLLDTLTKWNRNSSAFYRWARLPNDNVLSDSNKCIPNPSDVISRQDICRSYDLLQKQRLILRRYGPELDAIMTDITYSNQYKLQTEFKQRLDFISDCLKALPYQIHPMENFSIASETSTILHKFDAEIEKQILQSLVSSLKSQVDHRKSLIHSRIKGAYGNLLPSVYYMTEDGTIPFYERFHPYSKPELLQLASYLAQHDVAFNNLPVYSTEEGDGDDGNIEIQEPKSSAKKEKPKNAPVRPPIRSHSPPVRDTGIDVPPRKPLYAPTERQLNAAKASHLRQLINKSKTALLKLDREILAERSDLSLNEQKDRIGPSVAQRHLKCPMAPTGVLKPKVRVLGDKGARKIRRPASGKGVTKAISPTLHQCSRHAFDPRSSRDAKILSIYLQRLALEKSSADLNVPHNYIKTSAIHYEQQYPPGLIAFLEKWGSKLDNSSYKGVRRPQVHFTNNGQLESSTESVSNSTDSISEFIQRHANHNKPPQKLRSRSTESKSDLLKSTNALKSRKTSVERNSSRMISELKEGGTPYRILRLPVEQYQQLLARSKTEVVVKADRFNYENLLPFHKSERPAGIVQICDSLSEEIVNACVEASANLVDNLSNEVINELLRSELAVSTSSSWSSFSGISEFPQKMRPSDVKQLIIPVPSKSKIQPPTSKKHSIGKLTLQMPNQTGLKTLNPVKELAAPTNLSVPENKSQDFVLDGDLLARTSEIRSVISHSPDQEQIVAGDGSLIKRSSKERSVVERFSTPEEVRLKSSTSDIIQIKSINGGTLIKNASSNGSNSSPPSRVSSRKGSERGELVSLKKSFSQGYLVSIENHQTPTSRLQSQVTVGQNSLKSTLLQGVLTPKEMSPPKSVMLHDKPSSFDLITSLAGPLTPDTPTSKDNTTQETVPSLNGSSQFYEDDFESTEGIDSN